MEYSEYFMSAFIYERCICDIFLYAYIFNVRVLCIDIFYHQPLFSILAAYNASAVYHFRIASLTKCILFYA